MNESQNLDNGTRTAQTYAGSTAITKPCTFVRGTSLTRSTANRILDQAKEGQSYPQNILTLALIATNDMKGEEST
mgnify:CR=1 FL=1